MNKIEHPLKIGAIVETDQYDGKWEIVSSYQIDGLWTYRAKRVEAGEGGSGIFGILYEEELSQIIKE